MNNNYEMPFEYDPIVRTGQDYMLWLHPIRTLKANQVITTQKVNINDTAIKLLSSNENFFIHKGDYLNFSGKILLISEDTLITTNETNLPIYKSAFEIPENSFTVTQSLIPVLSDSKSTINIGSTKKETINEQTGYWAHKITVSRSIDIEFEGVMIMSDRLLRIMDVRQLYYFEFRNPVYFNDRRGTYRGIAEGVTSGMNDEMLTFKGSLLSQKNLEDWDITDNEGNPSYCPSLASYNIIFDVIQKQDLSSYCPSLASYNIIFNPIKEQDLSSYCQLDSDYLYEIN